MNKQFELKKSWTAYSPGNSYYLEIVAIDKTKTLKNSSDLKQTNSSLIK